MPKWRVNRDGIQWLVDAEDRVIGYKDKRGREYLIPSVASSSGAAENKDDPIEIGGLVVAYGDGTLGGSVMTIAAPGGTDVGAVLTATPSAGWTVGGYQWTRDGVDISGATSSTYTLVYADTGHLIGCRAVSPVYSALLSIPAGAFPAGYLSLDSAPIAIDGAVLSLV